MILEDGGKTLGVSGERSLPLMLVTSGGGQKLLNVLGAKMPPDFYWWKGLITE